MFRDTPIIVDMLYKDIVKTDVPVDRIRPSGRISGVFVERKCYADDQSTGTQKSGTASLQEQSRRAG